MQTKCCVSIHVDHWCGNWLNRRQLTTIRMADRHGESQFSFVLPCLDSTISIFERIFVTRIWLTKKKNRKNPENHSSSISRWQIVCSVSGMIYWEKEIFVGPIPKCFQLAQIVGKMSNSITVSPFTMTNKIILRIPKGTFAIIVPLSIAVSIRLVAILDLI